MVASTVASSIATSQSLAPLSEQFKAPVCQADLELLLHISKQDAAYMADFEQAWADFLSNHPEETPMGSREHRIEKLQEDGLSSFTRFWVDDMYMVGSLQVQAFKATGDTVYLNRAAKTIKVYCDKLQRPNGLFYHRADAPFYWGRGNGWAAAAFAELIQVLPEDHMNMPA